MSLSIAVIVGSLRRESMNRRLARSLPHLKAAQGHAFEMVEIGDLPLYNQDDDADPSSPVLRFKEQVRTADAVIFVTPEYNRSIPGVLKNAIDHGSRPNGESVWRAKPAGIMGMSPGPIGTAMAQQHLRNVLAMLNMPALTSPEAYLQYREGMFTPSGAPDERFGEFLEGWLDAFVRHVALHAASPG